MKGLKNLKKYRRFFAFGCSMTDYWWPTWADIFCKEIPESYNFGKSGAGNLYISLQIAEANARYKFNEHDLVMVMWSSIAREDRYFNRAWETPGNIYSQDIYNQEFVKKYADLRGYLIRDLGLISLADNMLKLSGCSYEMLNMSPFVEEPPRYLAFKTSDANAELRDVLELYSATVEKIRPDFLTTACNGKWPVVQIYHNDNQKTDYHPTPNTHLEYIKKIFPKIELSVETIYWMMEHEQKVQNAKTINELKPEDWKPPFRRLNIL